MSQRIVCDGGCDRAFPIEVEAQSLWYEFRQANTYGPASAFHLCPQCFAKHFQVTVSGIIDTSKQDQLLECSIAMEFGFRQHEKGHSLEFALENFKQTWKGE